MRIMYFLAHPNDIGGATKVMFKHAHIMSKRGHEVLLVIQTDENGYYNPIYNDLCMEYEVDAIPLFYSIVVCIEELDYLSALKDMGRVESVINKFNPDVIHSMQINVPVEMVSRRLGIVNVMNAYQADDEMFSISWADIFPHYHMADSEFYCNVWKNGLGTLSKCVRVPYEMKEIRKQKRDTDTIEIVNSGVFAEHKRQLEILKLVSLFTSLGMVVHVTFLGRIDTEYAQRCMEYAENEKIQGNVTFTGYVDNVEKFLIQADVMIHASLSESYPGAIVEAMACELPVISTPVGGIPELIQDQVNGFLTKGLERKDIADAFGAYLKCKEDGSIRDIIANAKLTYKRNHTYEAVGKNIEEFHKLILEGNHSNRDVMALDIIADQIECAIGSKIKRFASQYTLSRAFYLYYINELCKESFFTNVVIWGAGNLGHIGIEWAKILDLEIICFVDSNKTGFIEEYEILQPSKETLEKADVVIVSVWALDALREIKTKLESWGRKRNYNYFFVHNNPVI